jgi:hypothetical protein
MLTINEEITRIIQDAIYEGEIISEDDNINVEKFLRIMVRDSIRALARVVVDETP